MVNLFGFLFNWQRAKGTGEISITPGASPYTYQNTRSYDEDVVVEGGTVSEIAVSRDGSTFYVLQATTGAKVHLCPDDYLKVTYTVAPTMVSFGG